MIWKGRRKKRPVAYFEVISHLHGWTEENHDQHRDSHVLVETGTEYKSKALSLEPTFSVKKVSKVIPVTGRGHPSGCETSMLPHILSNQLTGGDEAVTLTRRPPFTPQEDSWYSFC
jgi:hypothetical protein